MCGGFRSAPASSRRFSQSPCGQLTIQKLSGTLIQSVLNEYTDFTNAGRELLSSVPVAAGVLPADSNLFAADTASSTIRRNIKNRPPRLVLQYHNTTHS